MIDQQLYSECSLVSALNAREYLTSEYMDPKSEEYDQLCEDACCKIGACIGLDLIYDRLNLEYTQEYFDYWALEKALYDGKLPIQVHVWHKRTGYHAVCIVDYEKKTNAIKIMNFRWETSTDCWIFLEDLKKWLYPLGPEESLGILFEVKS